MKPSVPRFIRYGRQRGAALVVVLILLLVMTWMGVSSMRGTAMGERMSAGIYDRSLAFQAAETGLREGEALLKAKTPLPAAGAGCSAGLCGLRSDLIAGDVMRWEDTAIAWRESSSALGVDNSGTGGIAVAPEFLVEHMGMGENSTGCSKKKPKNAQCESPRYRVTARSSEADRARVLLQAHVAAY
ncbi:MAG: hypothetical protein IPG63_11185 [Xanthomonadales bacterium]|nr:hypothetical protein [Xanthomonadales bacterium]